MIKNCALIDQYDQREVNFPSYANDWKKFETNNKLVTLNDLVVPHKEKELKQVYNSKHNSEHPS